MLNNEDLSMLLIKQGMSSFVWDSTVITKEKISLWFTDSGNNDNIEICVKSLSKEHFLEGVKKYFGSTPFSLYLELPLSCECDGCTDGEDEEEELKALKVAELLELLHGVFDRREGA